MSKESVPIFLEVPNFLLGGCRYHIFWKPTKSSFENKIGLQYWPHGSDLHKTKIRLYQNNGICITFLEGTVACLYSMPIVIRKKFDPPVASWLLGLCWPFSWPLGFVWIWKNDFNAFPTSKKYERMILDVVNWSRIRILQYHYFLKIPTSRISTTLCALI